MTESTIKYPEILNVKNWRGYQCQLGFYTFHYIGVDPDGLITEDGNANTYELHLPYDHKLNLISFSRIHTDSENLQVRYLPNKTPPDYYDILYSNTALTARSVIIELGDKYENLKDARVIFAITGTDTKKWKPRVNVKFLEPPI